MAEIGFIKDGTRYIGSDQLGFPQICPLQVGMTQVKACQIGSTEVSFTKVGHYL
jgi:hypothetical protein